MQLRIGHLSTFYHTAVILMADDALASELGCEVRWQLFGTGPAIVDALAQGELDMAYIGLPPALIGIERGVEIKCVAGGHMEGTIITGLAGFSAYPEAGDLKAVLSQFKGEKVGVPGRGSIHDVILSHCLREHGLEEDIEVENFKWSDMITEALAGGQLKAAFGTPALAVAAQRYAGCRLLYPADRLWPDNPSYGIFATNKMTDKRGLVVENFLRMHEEASETLRTRPQEASDAIAKFVGSVDSDLVKDTLAVSPRYCAQLTDGYVECTLEFSRVMKDLGYTARVLVGEEIFNRTWIDKIHPPGDHYREGISGAD